MTIDPIPTESEDPTTLPDPDIGDVEHLDDEIARLADAAIEDTQLDLPPVRWLIVVTCASEAEQAELLERFSGEGLPCKALIG
jgi:hypothetical protein